MIKNVFLHNKILAAKLSLELALCTNNGEDIVFFMSEGKDILQRAIEKYHEFSTEKTIDSDTKNG